MSLRPSGKRHHMTPEQRAAMLKFVEMLELMLIHRKPCGQCPACFRRGLVDALAVKVLEVERVGV